MARCEDFPACGHEMGCCPDFDPDTGEQLNMKCVCGATLPITRRSSLCDGCLRDPDDPDQYLPEDFGETFEDLRDEDIPEPPDTDDAAW